MAQASKAIIPIDPGGPFGQRIGVAVHGSLSWALIVGAYVVNRVNPADWKQYSIVVLNCKFPSISTDYGGNWKREYQGMITPMAYGIHNR
jgi:hypothetical protein